jgi:cell division septation protein DedD/cbb3-type cytochrome oxidase subunit 3
MNDQDDESRLGAYAPPADEFATFDARDEDTRRGPLLLTAAFAVFVLFLGVVWSAYNQGLRGGRDEPPRMTVDQEPYRVRPADPGGEETPDTDLDVYNRLTGDSDDAQDVSLRPAPEEPLDESRPALRVETDETDRRSAETTPPPPDVTPRQAPTRPPATQPETQSRPEVAEPTPQPSAPVTTGTTTVTPVAGGPWLVQIASFRSQADAEAAWVAFRTSFADVSAGLTPDVLQIEIPDRGTYHRLRIAAFGSRDDAVAFCSALQGRGQDCLVTRS